MLYHLINFYTKRFPFPRRGLRYFLPLMRFTGVLNRAYQKKLPGGILMNVNPGEHMQRQLFWHGYYEKPVGVTIKKLLNPGAVFLDIGANIGYFSLLAAKHCPCCKVIAFEPVSEIFEEMKRNIAMNNISSITTVNAAAGENEEETIIYLSSQENFGMSALRKPENYSGLKETAKVIDIDSWFSQSGLQKIDLVKIDAEGSEVAVLKGMRNTVKASWPNIIVEVNPETLSLFSLTTSDLAEVVGGLGYDALLIHENGSTNKTDISQVNTQVNVLLVPRGK